MGGCRGYHCFSIFSCGCNQISNFSTSDCKDKRKMQAKILIFVLKC